MATTTIPWGDGSGDNIYLTYSSASGDQTVEVSSDANTGGARTKVVTFSATGVSPVALTVNQDAGLSGVPYIRNTSLGAYIDTGIKADNNTRVIVWARNFNPITGYLFGSRVSSSSKMYGIGTYSAANTGRIRIDYGNNQTYADNQFANLSHYHKYELDGNVFKVDDTVIATATSATFSNNLNIYLFGINNNGSHSAPGIPSDICAVKIYKSGELVRDFTARNSPTVGLFDAVSNTLFTNSGTGSFTYGTFDPGAYTPLEYIGLSAQQHFDTGVYGKKELQVVCKFRIEGTSINSPTLFATYSTEGTYFRAQAGNGNYKNRYMYMNIESSTQQALYNSNSSKLTSRDLILCKTTTTEVRLYENNAGIGTAKTFTVSDSFVTPNTIQFGTSKNGTTVSLTNAFNGRFYYFGLGAERSYVPGKVNGVAGMYDTYNDVFKTSESDIDFAAGTEL